MARREQLTLEAFLRRSALGFVLVVSAAALRAETPSRQDAERAWDAEAAGDYEKAITIFTALVENKHSSKELLTQGYFGRGTVYLGIGDRPNALADLTKALEYSPNRWQIYSNRSRVLAQNADYQAAFADAKKAIDLSDGHPNTFLARAYVARLAKRWAEALDAIEAALARDSKLASAHQLRGRIYGEMERYPDAIVALNRALELEPDMEIGLVARGSMYYNMGDFGAAERDFRRAAATAPRGLSAISTLSYFLSACEDTTRRDGIEALKLAEKGWQLTGRRDPDFLELIALAQAELGDYQSATKRATEALRHPSASPHRRDQLKEQLEYYKRRRPYRWKAGDYRPL